MRINCKTHTKLLVLSSAAASVLGLSLIPVASAATTVVATGGTAGEAAPSTPAAAAPSKAKVRSTGIATWFGPGFYGQKTACGQTLTPEVVGVANRTLPCGTLVKIIYRGHAVTVPVLDRGPYGRIGAQWDLTAGAAAALDITETVRIQAKIVGLEKNSPLLGAPLTSPLADLAGGAVAAP